MFDIRKYGLLIAATIAVVVIACAPETKEDCDEENRDNKQGYEECLQQLERRQGNQTATSVAIRAATATENAVIAAERVEYAATVAALDESSNSSGDSQRLSRAGTITGQAPRVTAVVVPESGSSDLVSGTTPTPIATSAPLAPTTVATPAPIAPTAAPTPVPAPTEIPVDLSTLAWLTAQQAAELALMEVDGEVFEIAGHGARGAGELSTGDTTGAELSPGAGYARDWSVTVQNDVEAIFCQVGFGETSCNGGGFHYGDGEVGTVIADSPAAFERFESENNPDWQALLAYNDISILLDLHVDLSGAVNAEPGDPIARIWSATITVRDEGASPSGGSFHWNVDTDTITWSVF